MNIIFRIYNLEAITARGGTICGNNDFHIVRCASCGCQYSYEEEMSLIYHNPEDLSRSTFDFLGEEKPPCRCCGKEKWDYEELKEDDKQSVEKGDWSWLL